MKGIVRGSDSLAGINIAAVTSQSPRSFQAKRMQKKQEKRRRIYTVAKEITHESIPTMEVVRGGENEHI